MSDAKAFRRCSWEWFYRAQFRAEPPPSAPPASAVVGRGDVNGVREDEARSGSERQ